MRSRLNSGLLALIAPVLIWGATSCIEKPAPWTPYGDWHNGEIDAAPIDQGTEDFWTDVQSDSQDGQDAVDVPYDEHDPEVEVKDSFEEVDVPEFNAFYRLHSFGSASRPCAIESQVLVCLE